MRRKGICSLCGVVHERMKSDVHNGDGLIFSIYALKEIQHLYMIEHICNDAGLSPDERKDKCQELVRPIMEAMKLCMETEGVKYSESSLLGKAITYAYTR